MYFFVLVCLNIAFFFNLATLSLFCFTFNVLLDSYVGKKLFLMI